MNCFIILLFCIYFHDAFEFVNRKLVNRKSNHYMGCDYYIETNLWIHYDKGFGYVKLSKDKGYYVDNVSASNQVDWEKMKEYHIEPKTKPILIYHNTTLTNTTILNKYKTLLDEEIVKKDCKSWHDVKKIVMAEHRYERD